jgi:16S rRNA (guanine(966)-N(2))-methyltransferase RsmD
VGIEALSRGASSVHFAESSGHAARILRQNLASLGLEAGDVAERDAADALRQWDKAGARFDVCFLDPPYRLHGAYGEILRTVSRSALLREGGIVVAEHEKRFDPGEGEGDLKRYRLLRQGESALSFYRRSAAESKAVEE